MNGVVIARKFSPYVNGINFVVIIKMSLNSGSIHSPLMTAIQLNRPTTHVKLVIVYVTIMSCNLTM